MTSERCFDLFLAQVEAMVSESGNPEGFDARAWLERWLNEPLPAFDGKTPAEHLDKP
jgi:hypothetical protein